MNYAILRDDKWLEINGAFQSGNGADVVNHPAGWLDAASDEERTAIGIAMIDAPALPGPGLRIVSSELVDQDGTPKRVYVVEPVPTAEQVAAMTAAVVDRRDEVFRGGFAPKAGPLVGHRLDLRPGTDDRTNWLASQAAYGDAVANGFGDVVNATFRTVENQTVHVTYDDAKAVLLAMFTWANAVMAVSWDKKDAIDRGEAIDLDDGWPA